MCAVLGIISIFYLFYLVEQDGFYWGHDVMTNVVKLVAMAGMVNIVHILFGRLRNARNCFTTFRLKENQNRSFTFPSVIASIKFSELGKKLTCHGHGHGERLKPGAKGKSWSQGRELHSKHPPPVFRHFQQPRTKSLPMANSITPRLVNSVIRSAK